MKLKKNIALVFVASICVLGVISYSTINHIHKTKRNQEIQECINRLHTGDSFFDDWNKAFCTCTTDCMIEALGYNYKKKRDSFAFKRQINNCIEECTKYSENSWGSTEVKNGF